MVKKVKPTLMVVILVLETAVNSGNPLSGIPPFAALLNHLMPVSACADPNDAAAILRDQYLQLVLVLVSVHLSVLI